RIPLMEIRGPRGDFVRLRGEVRAITTLNGEDVAGVSIGPYSLRDEPRWNQIIAKTLYPTTDSGEQWADSLWQLFERSGYFSLSGKDAQNFVELRDSFVQVTEEIATRPQIVSTAVFPSERGVEATASVVKAYARSWCGHQLAKNPGKAPRVEPHQILRDLY